MAKRKDVIIRIGGAAGDGIASVGETSARVFSRKGLNVSAFNSYQSAIRGGHVWFQMRTGVEEVYSHGDHWDFLIPLNAETVDIHLPEAAPGGGIIFNVDKLGTLERAAGSGVKLFPIPVNQLTATFDKNPLYQNMVTLGVLIYLVGENFSVLESMIRRTFKKKGEKIENANVAVAKAGYDFASRNFQKGDFDLSCPPRKLMLLNGNTAIALGAVAAGCKFYSAYPMTPASGVLHWFATHKDQAGVVVKQMEDELAVINMAIGAAHAGVRAMCGTSGGGFALMTEAVGLAGMTETPLVVVESQRGGPSTGLPTKTEQGDLNQAFGASQGDFLKIILAPLNVKDCFYQTFRAFNLAEKYQTPVIVMSDLYLSERLETVDEFVFNLPIDRGQIATSANGEKFLRFVDTPTGVSPRAFPGQEGTVFVAASDEHDEEGIVISDVLCGLPDSVKVRKKIMEKRMRKQEHAVLEMLPPTRYGDADAPVTLMGWGSTQRTLLEAVQVLAQSGVRANVLAFSDLYPMNAQEVLKMLEPCKVVIDVEVNFTAQFARHLRAETGFNVTNKCLKYDGEVLTANDIVSRVKEVLANGARIKNVRS